MSPLGARELRKQLVLTHIALQRVQMAQEADALRRAVSPQRLVVGLVRAAFGTGWFSQLFAGAPAAAGGLSANGLAARVLQAWMLLRRYPALLTLLATALPWVRARRGLGRLALLASVGLGVAGATWVLIGARRRPPR